MNTKFSTERLKIIAIIAMVIDHITERFLAPIAYASSPDSFYFIAYEILRGIGRLTMPLMVFCLVEGFIYTRSLPKYLTRLAVFMIPAHFAFVFFETGYFFPQWTSIYYFDTSIIANLFLTLLFLTIAFKSHLPIIVKIISTFIIFILTLFCDWSFYPLILATIFYLIREHVFLKAFIFLVSAPVWVFFNRYIGFLKNCFANGHYVFDESWQRTIHYFMTTPYYQAFTLGLILVLPFLFLYNGKKTNKPECSSHALAVKKYFFYVFYPAHLLLLGFIANAIEM